MKKVLSFAVTSLFAVAAFAQGAGPGNTGRPLLPSPQDNAPAICIEQFDSRLSGYNRTLDCSSGERSWMLSIGGVVSAKFQGIDAKDVKGIIDQRARAQGFELIGKLDDRELFARNLPGGADPQVCLVKPKPNTSYEKELVCTANSEILASFSGREKGLGLMKKNGFTFIGKFTNPERTEGHFFVK